jgi:hypothetical protein
MGKATISWKSHLQVAVRGEQKMLALNIFFYFFLDNQSFVGCVAQIPR